jgi:nucleotidyltransferase/DNA polymerase involved in DNA repair
VFHFLSLMRKIASIVFHFDSEPAAPTIAGSFDIGCNKHHPCLDMTPIHEFRGDDDSDDNADGVAATELELHMDRQRSSLKRLRSTSPCNDEYNKNSPALHRSNDATGACTSKRGGFMAGSVAAAPAAATSTRQILLLDLDCFYAQAMCRRYGFDSQTTPLALLQWNSVLAVTYPARQAYGIKRGDSWETVHEKSRGQCHAVHVPILTTSATAAVSASTGAAVSASSAATASKSVHTDTNDKKTSSSVPLSLEQEYERFYCLSDTQQQEARRRELSVRKRSADGKASIECFRIASARILATVRQWILDHYDSSIVLERASIDEFFLDVTRANQKNASSRELADSSPHTVVIGETESKEELRTAMEREGESGCCATWNHNLLPVDQSCPDHDEIRRLRRGCDIAYQIRQAVYQQLGFTMSAGIGTNKTLAKLAVTYGKPAGQAVCFPRAVEYLLDHTPIRSCRNLGGKLGSAVAKLLPTDVPPTVGSIARHLSLPTLQHALSDQAAAQRVFDLARGVDRELVEAKTESSSAVLTKSITAFKSLNFAPPNTHRDVMGHTLTEAMPWIELLSCEVVTRIERDFSRNDRYPRNCSIHYAVYPASTHQDKSIRIPFPASRLSTEQKVAELVSAVPLALRSKVRSLDNESRDTRPVTTAAAGTIRLHRIGLCATNFESRAAGSNNAIENYFSAASAASAQDADSAAESEVKTLISGSAKPPRTILDAVKSRSNAADVTVFDADLEYARQLQATFDREHRVLEVLDKSSKAKAVNRNSRPPKNHCIDRFFLKR